MAQARKPTRWHQANVIQVGAEKKEIWQFSVNGKFDLANHESVPAATPVPPRWGKKDWQTLWQKKLNIAWLPNARVYLRALQLPTSDTAEIRSMVELQLEKISPMPLAFAVWTAIPIGPMINNLQSVVVVILSRDDVEACLGQLEKEGYLADRLELPLLDQLLAQNYDEDGVWIFVEPDRPDTCLSLWWSGGFLQHVSLHSGCRQPQDGICDQLTRIAWTGELGGWLHKSPKFRVVAEPGIAAEWEQLLAPVADSKVKTSTPIGGAALAGLTARRVVEARRAADLLPEEYGLRYRQQLVDQVWMRALGAVIALYLVGLVVYFAAVGALFFQTNRVESRYTELSGSYTNAVKMRERVKVLEQQSHLKFAALDAWKLAAEKLPTHMTLTSMSLQKGRILNLYGEVPQDQRSEVYDYNESLAKSSINGEGITVESPKMANGRNEGGNVIVVPWDFSCHIGKGTGE